MKRKRPGIIDVKKGELFQGMPYDVELILTRWSTDEHGGVVLSGSCVSEQEIDHEIDGLIADLEHCRKVAHKWLGPDLEGCIRKAETKMNSPQVRVVPEVLGRECIQFKFYCAYCRCNHYHGVRGGLGHRAAHCTSAKSVYTESGYILTLDERKYEIITVSMCPPEISREWHASVKDALAALRLIDTTGCGHMCMVDPDKNPRGKHWIEFRMKK